MKIQFPNSAHMRNIGGFIRKYDPVDDSRLSVSFHPKWVHIDPFALVMGASLGLRARDAGIPTFGTVPEVSTLPYMLRMHLFDFLQLSPRRQITEHEESGRFIPLTQITNSKELRDFLTNLVPLLHADAGAVSPIRYVISELVRNVLEHAESPSGALVCAQYYKRSSKLSLAVGDSGRGVLVSMRRSHAVNDYKSAIRLALMPGITGATSRVGGNESNAGAGLFFTKGLAFLSRNYFALYSGDCLYKLLPTPTNRPVTLHTDPESDSHRFETGLPRWQGTIVGINLSITNDEGFERLIEDIVAAYSLGARGLKKNYSKEIRFR